MFDRERKSSEHEGISRHRGKVVREEETEAGCIGDCRREREKEEAEELGHRLEHRRRETAERESISYVRRYVNTLCRYREKRVHSSGNVSILSGLRVSFLPTANRFFAMLETLFRRVQSRPST